MGGGGGAGLGALEADRSKHGTTGNTTSSGFDSSKFDRHGLDTTGCTSISSKTSSYLDFRTTLRTTLSCPVARATALKNEC